MAARRDSRRLRGESGYTLVELLVATALMLVIVSAGGGLLVAASRSQPRLSDRSAELQQGRVLIERITRELRQGDGIPTSPVAPTESSLSILTYVNSATCGGAQSGQALRCRVTYQCAAGACTRTERNPDGTGSAPAETVVEGLRTSSVFRYGNDDCADPPSATPASFVRVCLSYPADDGQESVTLDDGAALRNAVLAAQ